MPSTPKYRTMSAYCGSSALHTTKLTLPSYRFSKRIIAGAASRQEMHHGA